jgi:hypothetical protein
MARMGILGTVVFALASVSIPAYLSGSKAEVPLSLVSVLGALICFECARNSQ